MRLWLLEIEALAASQYFAGVSRIMQVSEVVKVGSQEAVCQLDLSLFRPWPPQGVKMKLTQVTC